jgi:beta-lactamase regulating signal transducer with metallopeptidase domain
MNAILDMTLRGSLAAILIVGLDRMLGGAMSARFRRWWWGLAPLAFLLPFRLPVLPGGGDVPLLGALVAAQAMKAGVAGRVAETAGPAVHPFNLVLWVWVAGAAAYAVFAVAQTVWVTRRWRGERLSTDHELLELIEDCKREAGVTAPVGLVVSASVPGPAILGWLRPRILLPAGLAASFPRKALRPIILHELAHLRAMDLPLAWLYTAARAVHWFNPVAHLAAGEWVRFREEAADETAVRWMGDASGREYGDTLIRTLRHVIGGAPFGSLAILESPNHIKRRVIMINRTPGKTSRGVLAALVVLLIVGLTVAAPVRASDGDATLSETKAAAVAAMLPWLHEIDGGLYAQSWKDASVEFRHAVTADDWSAKARSVRDPLGVCRTRKLLSAALQEDSDNPNAAFHGHVVARFQSSFDRLSTAIETVAFRNSPDGVWRAAGYFIRPGLPPPARKAIALPSESLQEYTGAYPLTPEFVLKVTVEGGAVFVQATGQEKVPVFASAKDEFFYRIVDARISFRRGPDGRIIGLTLHQNGMNLPGEKEK